MLSCVDLDELSIEQAAVLKADQGVLDLDDEIGRTCDQINTELDSRRDSPSGGLVRPDGAGLPRLDVAALDPDRVVRTTRAVLDLLVVDHSHELQVVRGRVPECDRDRAGPGVPP